MPTVYEIVTDRILKMLEAGTVPWRRPWAGGESPRNGQTRKNYRGVNVFLLGCKGYESPDWLTYKQAKDLNGQVRKGEKSTPVIFWKWLEKKEKEASDTDEPKSKRILLLRYYSVFNISQCDGLPANKFSRPDLVNYPVNPIESANKVIRSMPHCPEITHGGGKAEYDILADCVNMPPRERFKQSAEYYSALFHELTHATGHDSRLNRKFGGRFGDSTHAKEELVAEMGAAFLCGHTDIENTLDNSAAYLQSWIRHLKGDSKLAIIAAAQAQKAADYILDVDAKEQAESERLVA